VEGERWTSVAPNLADSGVAMEGFGDEEILVHGRNSDRWGRTFRGVGGRENVDF